MVPYCPDVDFRWLLFQRTSAYRAWSLAVEGRDLTVSQFPQVCSQRYRLPAFLMHLCKMRHRPKLRAAVLRNNYGIDTI